VSSALHVHPATDTLLHYISLGVQWTLVGIDERWRKEVKVVFRKRAVRDFRLTIDDLEISLRSCFRPCAQEPEYNH